MENRAPKIAEFLLKINAVKLNPSNPFTWTSGLRSPIYCDNRLSLSFPEHRNYLKESFAELIRNQFPTAEALSGVATAGIAHGALAADALALPFSYVRSGSKGHGLKNQIEGQVLPGQKVVVVEDLVSTGGSSLKAVEVLRDAGVEVLGLVAIFTYGFEKSVQAFQDAQVPFFSLTNLNQLLHKAVEIKYIQPSDMTSIENWRQDPEGWSLKQVV